MTLIIELSPESEARLNRAARGAGVKPEEFARRLIEALPTVSEMQVGQIYTALELLKLPESERAVYLRAAAERAAAVYEADLALPVEQRDLTAFSAVSGTDILDNTASG